MTAAVDTIAAVATPPGRGAIGVVRVSGPYSQALGQQLLGVPLAPRHATLCDFRDEAGEAIDRGIALFFPSPHSYTGEDVLELHGHGGPVVMDALLQRLLRLGARPARPGEFSERAFLNGKLDLAQAEAVSDLIDASSAQAARGAMRALSGEFSRRMHDFRAALIRLQVQVEAAIDFPEEEIDFLANGQIAAGLDGLLQALDTILSSAEQGALLRDGMRVVIAGAPNAGKSSLLNALTGQDSAIVTAIPGTTRDLLREHIHLDGMPVHVVDTAGLRDSSDPIEQEGMRRARVEMIHADRILLVVDSTQIGAADLATDPPAQFPELRGRTDVTVVLNKIDTSGLAAEQRPGEWPAIALSAKTGTGLGLLRDHLKDCMGYRGEGTFTTRRRHLDALERTKDHLGSGRRALALGAGELVAEDLRRAQRALGEITGEYSSDDLLESIFASFCIGK